MGKFDNFKFKNENKTLQMVDRREADVEENLLHPRININKVEKTTMSLKVQDYAYRKLEEICVRYNVTAPKAIEIIVDNYALSTGVDVYKRNGHDTFIKNDASEHHYQNTFSISARGREKIDEIVKKENLKSTSFCIIKVVQDFKENHDQEI